MKRNAINALREPQWERKFLKTFSFVKLVLVLRQSSIFLVRNKKFELNAFLYEFNFVYHFHVGHLFSFLSSRKCVLWVDELKFFSFLLRMIKQIRRGVCLSACVHRTCKASGESTSHILTSSSRVLLKQWSGFYLSSFVYSDFWTRGFLPNSGHC